MSKVQLPTFTTLLIKTIRQHLLSFVKTQICQPVILVGASMGSAVAINFGFKVRVIPLTLTSLTELLPIYCSSRNTPDIDYLAIVLTVLLQLPDVDILFRCWNSNKLVFLPAGKRAINQPMFASLRCSLLEYLIPKYLKEPQLLGRLLLYITPFANLLPSV